MSCYLTAQICMNGHCISESVDKYSVHSADYCPKCGAKTITACPNCGAKIRGEYYVEGFCGLGHDYSVPNFCHNCGTPYPWTSQILENAVQLLDLDDTLNEDAKQLIKSAIPDLIVDSPSAPIAAAKYRKGMGTAGEFIKNSMYNLLVDVLSETAKKLIWPGQQAI